MNYSARQMKSPAHRAVDICWQKCLPKDRHKYLQSFEILNLIRELEKLLNVSKLLKPEEENLLRCTLLQKPKLRLFKGECLSFLLGLVHCSSVDEFLETRLRLSRGQIVKLIDDYERGTNEDMYLKKLRDSAAFRARSLGINNDRYDGYGASYRSLNKDTLRYSEPEKKWKDSFGDSLNAQPALTSWLPKWRQESSGNSNDNGRYKDRSEWRDNLPRENENGSWVTQILKRIGEWLSGKYLDVRPLRESSYCVIEDPLKPPLFFQSVKVENTPTHTTSNERKLHDIKESLADIRAHTRQLEEESMLDSKLRANLGSNPGSTNSISKALDELQAAVKEQAKIISRLEREREYEFRTRGPFYVSMLYMPWDYFTNYTKVFLRDLIDELIPRNRRTPPEFVIRILALVLGYFVIMNFFKLVYFLAVLVLTPSGNVLSYSFSRGVEGYDSAPVSWVQYFPFLEYWTYQLRDWMGY